MTDTATDSGENAPKGETPPPRELSPAARRALAEAQARRAEIDRATSGRAKEVNGRAGPDPARYRDWESKGIASDF